MRKKKIEMLGVLVTEFLLKTEMCRFVKPEIFKMHFPCCGLKGHFVLKKFHHLVNFRLNSAFLPIDFFLNNLHCFM